MDGKSGKSKAKSKSKEKVDLKKLFRVSIILSHRIICRCSFVPEALSLLCILMQFQSFSQRIANIRIDVSHRVGRTAESPEVRISTVFGKNCVTCEEWKRSQCCCMYLRVGHEHNLWWLQDQETFFSEALQKWNQLNCTSDFVSFEREVRTKVDTLAQLVHHKVRSGTHSPKS